MVNKLKTAFILCAVGAVLVPLRLGVQASGGVPTGDSVWQVVWDAQVKVNEPPVSIRFKAPTSGPGTHVVKQETVLPEAKITAR